MEGREERVKQMGKGIEKIGKRALVSTPLHYIRPRIESGEKRIKVGF